MHRIHPVLPVLALAAGLALSSCCTKECLKEEDRRTWYLTCITIDKNQLMQQKIIATIDAAVSGGSAPAGRKNPPVAGETRRAREAGAR